MLLLLLLPVLNTRLFSPLLWASLYAEVMGTSWGLPPVWQKKVLNVAFPATKFRRGGDLNITLNSLYIAGNQLYITTKTGRLINLSGLGQASTDFEFNKPILKKGTPILKDFEKKATDFEGFRKDFEIPPIYQRPQPAVCKALFVPEYRNIGSQAAFIGDFNTLAA